MNNVAFPELGLEFTLKKTAFSIGSLNVQWYGIIIAVGFALAVFYCLRRAPKFGILQDNLIDMTLIATPAAIIGARLYYVVFNWSQFAGDPVSVFRIWEGGIAIYGALIFGAIAAFIYCRVKKINVLNLFDLAILGFMIGQCVGRWGNFVNAEAYGQTVENWFLGMSINGGLTVHPIFLYESLWNLVGFIFLAIWTRKGKRQYDGQATLLYFVWYGLIRFLLEPLRTSPLLIPGTALRASQVIGGGMCLVALVILVVQSRRAHRPEDLYVNRVRAQSAAAEEKEKTPNGSEDKTV